DAGAWAIYDLATGSWAAERVTELGLDARWLPDIQSGGTIIGPILPQAAKRYHLPEGTAVVTGAWDTIAASIGTAAVDAGVVGLACGSWFSFTLPVSKLPPAALVDDGFDVYPHPGPLGYTILVTNPNGMRVIDWARDVLGLSRSDVELGLSAGGRGPGPVVATPELMPAPYADSATGWGGSVSGITLATRRIDIVRAFLEGMACEMSRQLDRLRAHGIEASLVRASGGGARLAWWLQLMADICGVPFEVVEQEEPGTFGAAILAGVGCGVYRSVSDAAGRLVHVSRRFEPDTERGALYTPTCDRLARDRMTHARAVEADERSRETSSTSTPALVVDLDVFDDNIASMARLLDGTGKTLRPHVKTHRTPALALRQLGAHARGITCATVGEAEAMVAAGLNDVLIANEIVDPAKITRLVALAHEADIGVALDDAEPAEAYSRLACRAGVTLKVLIDVDILLHRCGVATVSEAVALARTVEQLKGLQFTGLMGYEGRVRLGTDGRSQKIARAYAVLSEVRDGLLRAGFRVDTVSAAGTSTLREAIADPVITELQAGTYALMEPELLPMDLPFRCAVVLRGTIISRHDDRAVLDVGRRSVGMEYGPPVPADFAATRVLVTDEHTVVMMTAPPPLGTQLDLVPGQVRTTFNLHDHVWVSRGGRIIDRWPITARGASD
ncbi:MAG: alanine racemase, partial [Candidatus Limnocylindrales bacterium]